MSRMVEVAAGKTLVELPFLPVVGRPTSDSRQRGPLNAGDVAVLTNEEFAMIPGSAFTSGILIDRGEADELLGVKVTAAGGTSNVQLPNGNHVDAGASAYLTKDEFLTIPATVFPSVLVNADDKLVQIDRPITLNDISANGVVWSEKPGFAGEIVTVDFIVTVAVTTAGKAVTLVPVVRNKGTNGASLALTSANCTPVGAEISATAITASRNEVQTLTIATTTGGTFRITFNGSQTAALANTITAAALQTALEGLASIGVGNVLVGGGPANTSPLTLTFRGTLANTDVALATISNDSLTDGGSHTATLVETTKGGSSGFSASDSIDITASALTRFVEGAGVYRLTLRRT